jgi:hypothetical protein
MPRLLQSRLRPWPCSFSEGFRIPNTPAATALPEGFRLCRVSPRPGLQAARRSARRVQKRKSFVFGRAAGWEPGLSSVRSMRFLDAAAETVRSPDTIAAPASAWWRKTSVSKHCAGWGCLFCEGCAFQSPSASRCRVGSRSASDFVHALDEVPQQSLASTCSLDPAPCSWRAAPPCAVPRWCTGPCTGSARIIPWQPSAEPSRGRNGGNFASLPKTEAYQWLVGMGWRRGWDSNPRCRCQHSGFRDRPNRPLWHPSAPAGLLHEPSTQRNGARRLSADAPPLRIPRALDQRDRPHDVALTLPPKPAEKLGLPGALQPLRSSRGGARTGRGARHHGSLARIDAGEIVAQRAWACIGSARLADGALPGDAREQPEPLIALGREPCAGCVPGFHAVR